MKYLIAGLGNPGVEYKLTRHNIGFLVVDYLAAHFKEDFKLEKHGHVAICKFKGRTFYLLKPTTYMNLSGKAINYWLQQLKIPTSQLLVVTDDISLPYESTRLKKKGSHGGHNGLLNIEQTINTNQYHRLRIGVGDDFPKGKQVDYVLGDFTSKESEALPHLLEKSSEIIRSFVTIGADRTMNQFN